MANVKVGLIGALDMLKFKNMKKVREAAIQKAPAEEIKGVWAINENAKALHPEFIEVVVKEVIDHKNASAKTFIFSKEDGSPLPYFRAGQYISLKLDINGTSTTRAYSISSSPKWALESKYAITVKDVKDGFVAPYILNNLKVGTKLVISAPLGEFYYQKYRDEKTLVCLAGGSGITPFLSMAYAVRDGIEDYNLVILSGSRNAESILFEKELADICKATSKVKVVHVLSDETKDGYEHGFITSDLIKKYAGDAYSIYICGPSAMYEFLSKELKKLDLPRRLVRSEAMGVTKEVEKESGYPKTCVGKTFTLTVIQGPKTYTVKASSNETILVALERAGIKAPSRCRSGECGWCRSRVTKGTFYISGTDSRRWSDVKWNEIHPCCTFATSDMTIEVAGEYFPKTK